MSVDPKRRFFLKGALTTGAMTMLAGAGLLTPRSLLAVWPKEAFEADAIPQALTLLLGDSQTRESGSIRIKLTPHADSSGSEVSIMVKTDLPDVESISILVADSPTPLAASFRLGAGMEGSISTRLKIAKSGEIIAVVKTQQRLFSTRKSVDLTGCGCE